MKKKLFSFGASVLGSLISFATLYVLFKSQSGPQGDLGSDLLKLWIGQAGAGAVSVLFSLNKYGKEPDVLNCKNNKPTGFILLVFICAFCLTIFDSTVTSGLLILGIITSIIYFKLIITGSGTLTLIFPLVSVSLTFLFSLLWLNGIIASWNIVVIAPVAITLIALYLYVGNKYGSGWIASAFSIPACKISFLLNNIITAFVFSLSPIMVTLLALNAPFLKDLAVVDKIAASLQVACNLYYMTYAFQSNKNYSILKVFVSFVSFIFLALTISCFVLIQIGFIACNNIDITQYFITIVGVSFAWSTNALASRYLRQIQKQIHSNVVDSKFNILGLLPILALSFGLSLSGSEQFTITYVLVCINAFWLTTLLYMHSRLKNVSKYANQFM